MTNSIAAIAALGLPTRATLPAGPLPADAFASLLAHARSDRLSGLLVEAVNRDLIALTPPQCEEVASLDLEVQSQVVKVEHELLVVADCLAQAEIPIRVLKGPAFAHRFWSDPRLRPFVDFDLLVPGERLSEVLELCRTLGAHRRVPELRRRFDQRFAKSVTLVGPNGFEWDLHRTIALGPFTFLVCIDDLWAGDERFVLAGVELAMPTREVCLVHACMHATTSPTQRLTMLRDVVEIGQRADLGEAAAIGRRWSATAAVVDAVRDAAEKLQLEPSVLEEWAGQLAPTGRERRLLNDYRDQINRASRLALHAWRHVPGWRAKLAYGAALAAPGADNRSARRRTMRDQFRRLLRAGH